MVNHVNFSDILLKMYLSYHDDMSVGNLGRYFNKYTVNTRFLHKTTSHQTSESCYMAQSQPPQRTWRESAEQQNRRHHERGKPMEPRLFISVTRGKVFR